jgi:hypothetical protein
MEAGKLLDFPSNQKTKAKEFEDEVMYLIKSAK